MLSTTYTPPHPMVLVCDYDNLDAVIPESNRRSIIRTTETCISIRTIPDVDGDVTVTLASALPPEVLDKNIEVFGGSIYVPGKKIAVVTSENEKLLEIAVASDHAKLRIFVDQKKYPSAIWIEAR